VLVWVCECVKECGAKGCRPWMCAMQYASSPGVRDLLDVFSFWLLRPGLMVLLFFGFLIFGFLIFGFLIFGFGKLEDGFRTLVVSR